MNLSWDQILERALEHFDDHPPRSRYAPSPTGPLHLGNVRTALIAWTQARLSGAAFVMRVEDLDEPRSVDGSQEEILDDLEWLGIDWDEGPRVGGPCGPYVQSQRKAIYEAALAHLDQTHAVFRCYCSRKDIAEASSAPHSRGRIYPGTCRDLTPEQEVEVQAAKNGKEPSHRIRTGSVSVTVDDEIAGTIQQDIATDVGDFVVRRADGYFAYQLAVVVDDLLMGITDILRAVDLLDSTPRQAWLFEKLGSPWKPRFWHVPLMTDASGKRLSKRDGSQSLGELRDKGLTAEDVVGKLALSLGWRDDDSPITATSLLESVTLDDIRNLS